MAFGLLLVAMPLSSSAMAELPLRQRTFEAAWIPRRPGDEIGMTDLKWAATLSLPPAADEAPLTVTPSFAVHYLDRSGNSDLPPRV